MFFKKKTDKKNNSTKKSTTKKTTAKKSSSKKKSTPKKTTAKKTTPKKSTVKKTTPKKVTAKKSTTKKTTPKKTKVKKTADKKPKVKKAKKKISVKKQYPIKAPFPAYKGTKPYIFISYAHDDMSDVFKIIDKLNEKGYRIWYDEGIEPGNEWPESVGSAILKCSQFIVFMSSSAAKSRNVRNEINLAYNEQKDWMVVMMEKARLSGGMKLQLGTVQYINKYELTAPAFFEKIFTVLNSDLKN
jgi:hypothetical protein